MEADVIRTLRCERTAITDDANNYLYTHWDILVEVNWQPALMAYTNSGVGTAPVYTPGTFPGATDLAILSRMLQPRGLLTITAGGAIVLQSPALLTTVNPQPDNGQRYPCDVTGGPVVEAVGVPQMIGFRHWVVTLHITTDVRDIARVFPVVSRSAVVSNLWVSAETIDFQRRSVRQFAGRAILRADVMRAGNVNANSFRDLFLFKCPNHYQRMNVSVKLSEDGSTVDWSFEDQMRGYDLGVGSMILDIECYRTGSVKRGSPLKAGFDIARSIARSGSLLTIPIAVFSACVDNLPTSFRHCRCDLTGDRNANLGSLSAIAMGICINNLGFSQGRILTGSMEITFRQDIGDKVYTSVEMSSQYTDDAILGILRNIDYAPGFDLDFPGLDGAFAQLDRNLNAASNALTLQMQQDSRRLVVVRPPGEPANFNPIPVPTVPQEGGSTRFVIASRQGDEGFQDNPALIQGAFGTIPQTTVGLIPPPIRDGSVAAAAAVATAAIPVGSIPAGIEHLIVQALLGQNQGPTEPTALVTDS